MADVYPEDGVTNGPPGMQVGSTCGQGAGLSPDTSIQIRNSPGKFCWRLWAGWRRHRPAKVLTKFVHPGCRSWSEGAPMLESELLQRTRRLVQQSRLPPTLGIGEQWIIVLAASPSLPSIATERYEQALEELRGIYPDDVLDFSHTARRRTTRYLLLRSGSLAVSYWLTRTS